MTQTLVEPIEKDPSASTQAYEHWLQLLRTGYPDAGEWWASYWATRMMILEQAAGWRRSTIDFVGGYEKPEKIVITIHPS